MSTLAERLAALKAARSPQESEVPKEPATMKMPIEKNPMKAKLQNLQKGVEEKLETPTEPTPVDPVEVKRIVQKVEALEATSEMKELAGFNWQQFQDSLFYINDRQNEGFPEISSALTVINKDLRNYPELAHLLSTEQVSAIVQRILIQKNLWIAPEKKKAKAKKAKAPTAKELLEAAQSLDLSDL